MKDLLEIDRVTHQKSWELQITATLRTDEILEELSSHGFEATALELGKYILSLVENGDKSLITLREQHIHDELMR